ncbi:hypothetical protein ACLOJK_013814 [Asimina triloba]
MRSIPKLGAAESKHFGREDLYCGMRRRLSCNVMMIDKENRPILPTKGHRCSDLKWKNGCTACGDAGVINDCQFHSPLAILISSFSHCIIYLAKLSVLFAYKLGSLIELKRVWHGMEAWKVETIPVLDVLPTTDASYLFSDNIIFVVILLLRVGLILTTNKLKCQDKKGGVSENRMIPAVECACFCRPNPHPQSLITTERGVGHFFCNYWRGYR